MGHVQSKWIQIGTIIISLLALFISGVSLYYTINDHTEELAYDMRSSELYVYYNKE